MIDIHTHILPGVDDGAKTMKEALQMARMEVTEGVDTLILTPHCNVGYYYENYYDDRMESFYDDFDYIIKEQQLPINVLPGMEVYATLDLPELLTQKKLITLNHSRYLLMEFGFDIDEECSTFLLEEILNLGYHPIIAHPERYPIIQRYPELAGEWVEMGCALQVNKDSILGSFGSRVKESAIMLLEQLLVAFVASDCHGMSRRKPGLFDAYHWIEHHFSAAYAELLLIDNPKRVLHDMDLISLPTKEYRRYQALL